MFSHDDYTVGWVCALPLEMTAAIAILDEVHPDLSCPESDHNAYALGSIAGHNVVIACLPTGVYGTISAATVLSQMLPTFRQLRFGMMVGIGGGVPSSGHDIRLGDVVVSKPTGSCGGVVQYDLGKALQGGLFEQTGSLNHPPQVLLTHMSLLQATMADSENGCVYPLVQTALSQHPQMTEVFSCPGPKNDILFDAAYPHNTDTDTNGTCMSCDPDQVVQRKQRRTLEPHIHYGTIASGNQVIKDSQTRDRLAKELNVLCFEMEAAGMMNQLPCLVVRGICDYSDSHKNKGWQGYAALTAAAYSKLLLSTLKPRIVQHISKSTKSEMIAEKKACLATLLLSDPEEDRNALKRRRGERAPGTCNWILDTEELQKWLGLLSDGPGQLDFKRSNADIRSNMLWLYGNPGTGKSTMAVAITEELPRKSYFGNGKTMAYFFCDASSIHRRTAVSVLRGLLYQLIKGKPDLIELLFSKYQERKDALFSSFDALWSVLINMGKDVVTGEKYCIIDAIDECEAESQEMLLAQISQTFNKPDYEDELHLHILVTSRPYPEIGRYLNHFNHQNLSQYDQVAKDLKRLIKAKVRELSTNNRYSEKVAAQVAEILEDKAEGTFLWVGIACTELANVRSRDAVKTLQEMPSGLHSLYRNLLDTALTHSGEENQMLLQMMSVVAISQQPLTVAELSIACNLYPDEDEENRLNFTHEDIELCRLMVVVQDGVVRLLHKSVKDFLLRKGGENPHLVDDIKAHAALAYRCLDTWLEHLESFAIIRDQKLLPDIEFLDYAARYWGVHAHHAKSEFRVLKQHERFFRAKSPERAEWVNKLEFILDLPSNHAGFSALHIAALFGINSLVDFVFNEMRNSLIFGPWRKAQPRFNDAQFADGDVPTVLEIAAEHGQCEIMSLLLKRKTDKMVISARVLEAAAMNEDNGDQMMALLLKHKVQVNESVFIAAAGNRSHGGVVISQLLDQGWGLISQSAQVTEINGVRSGRQAALFDSIPRAKKPTITDEVLKAAAKNPVNGTPIMTKILSKLGHGLLLNDEVMEEMCTNLEPSVLQLFLSQKEYDVPLTLGLVLAATRDASAADQKMTILLDLCDSHQMSGHDILDHICGRVGSAVINKLLDGQDSELALSGPNVMAVAWNTRRNEVIDVMLNRCPILSWSDVAVAICINFDADVVRNLLDKVENAPISTQIIRAIAGRRSGDSKSLMKTMLLHPRTTLGEEEVAFICQLFDADVIHVLLDKKERVKVTLDLLTSIDVNEDKKGIMMELLRHAGGRMLEPAVIIMICKMFDAEVVELLSQKQNGLGVTAELINASFMNKAYSGEVMGALIRQSEPTLFEPELVAMICRLFNAQVVDQLPDIGFSSSLVHAAAHNAMYGKEVMALLFIRQGRFASLDHEAVAAVYEVFADNLEMIELLHNRIHTPSLVYTANDLEKLCEGDSQVTAAAFTHCDASGIATLLDKYALGITAEEAIECAASNEIDAKNMILLLLDKFEDQYQLTEAMFEAAAANEYQGTDAMEVLLDWEESSHLVTTNVVRVAASNNRSGGDLIELFRRRFSWIVLTDETLKAALANPQSGEKIIGLLEEHSAGATIHITPDIVKIASAANADDVLKLLLDSHRIHLQVQQDAVATICQLFGFGLVHSLLSRYGEQVVITDDVVAAAAMNCVHGAQVLSLLLGQQKQPPETIEKALEAAAASDEITTMSLLLEQHYEQDTIPEDIVCAAAGNIWGSCAVLCLLLDRFASNIPITERVLLAAAARDGSGPFAVLLRRLDQIPITDAVFQLASTKQGLSERELALLRRGHSAWHASQGKT